LPQSVASVTLAHIRAWLVFLFSRFALRFVLWLGGVASSTVHAQHERPGLAYLELRGCRSA